MTWQDLVMTIGTIIFIIALLPSVLSKDKPAISTSVLTGSVLGVFVVVYYSLNLYTAAFTNTISSAMWFVLAFQKIKNKPRRR
jgi:uncharacterized protein with PQ loop repeat